MKWLTGADKVVDKFSGTLLKRTRCPETSLKATLWMQEYWSGVPLPSLLLELSSLILHFSAVPSGALFPGNSLCLRTADGPHRAHLAALLLSHVAWAPDARPVCCVLEPVSLPDGLRAAGDPLSHMRRRLRGPGGSRLSTALPRSA